MKTFLKYIFIISLSMLLGGLVVDNYKKPEIIYKDKEVVKIVTKQVFVEPKIEQIETIRIEKIVDTVVDTIGSILLADQVLHNFAKTHYDYYRLNFSHDFEPDSTFQGAKIDCIIGFTLLDASGQVSPKPIKRFSNINLQPYPAKQIYVYKTYSGWKKICWLGLGTVVGVGINRIWENNK